MPKKHERLGTEKIGKLLFQQSMPAVIGLLVISLYNVVDTIFIGQSAGAIGIAALTIAFPIQMVVMALAQTLGIGASSIISRQLGAKKIEKAQVTLGNFFSASLILSVIAVGLGLFFLEPLLIIFGATETILPHAIEYMRIILLGSAFLVITAGANSVIRAEGAARFAMMIMMMSAGINLILDPILIFGMDMGLKGAAIATVIAQVATSFAAIGFFIKGRSVIPLTLGMFKLKLKVIKEIVAIGSSSLARMASNSVMAAILNHSLGFYGGDLAIAAFGIVNRVLMIVFMPMFGIVQGLQPILGYNYGAKSYERAKNVTHLTLKVSTAFSVVAFFLLFLLSRAIISIFTQEEALIDLSDQALRLIILGLPFIGFQVVTAGYLQALGKAVKAFIFSILRQIILLIPLVLLLPTWFDLNGVFYAFPISDTSAAILTFILMWYEIKTLNQKIAKS